MWASLRSVTLTGIAELNLSFLLVSATHVIRFILEQVCLSSAYQLFNISFSGHSGRETANISEIGILEMHILLYLECSIRN